MFQTFLCRAFSVSVAVFFAHACSVYSFQDDLPTICFGDRKLTASAASKPEVKTIKRPGIVDDVAVADSGRYLLLHIKQLGKIATFDAKAKEVVYYFPVPGSGIKDCAGATKLIIVDPTKSEVSL